MWHKIILVGNLGKDPESRFTDTGKQVTSFSVATSEKWTSQDGQKQEKTVWWKVSAWGKLAEITNEYLKKGSKVLVEGTIVADNSGNPRLWQTTDGQSRASFEVRAEEVRFLSTRGESKPQAEESEEEIPF